MDFEHFFLHELDNTQVDGYVHGVRQTLLNADIDKAPLIIFLCDLIEIGLKVYNDYKQHSVIVIFLLEEFNSLFLRNANLEKQNEDAIERLNASKRIDLFNMDKIKSQERLINEQSLKLIDRKVRIQKIEEKLASVIAEADEYKNCYNTLCQEYKNITEKYAVAQREVDRNKSENRELSEKLGFIANTLKVVFK